MKIKATQRKEQGTSASRRLRRAGNVPGIIYGDGEATPITLDHNNLWHTMRQEGAHTSILEIDVDGTVTKAITRDIQYHAYKPFILHIDFQRVNMNQTIVMRVPVIYTGAEESPAVKLNAQIINHIVNELEIECLPGNLPDHITVDLSKLEANGALHLSDITLPKGVSAVHHGEEVLTLVTAAAPTTEETSEEASTEEAAKEE